MLEFIGILAIIAIIFGISLSNAFWGLFSFAVGLIIACIIINALGTGTNKLLDWITKPSTPKQKLSKTEIERRKENAKQIFFALTVIAIIVTAIVAILSLALYGDLSFGVGH